MKPQIHKFRLTSAFGPEDVMHALKTVCDHPNQRDFAPAFEFDWIKRKVTLSANSGSGLAECRAHFLRLIAERGAEEDSMLAGVVIEADGRYTQPFGVAVHDPATFGELIGKGLVETGLRGVQVFDSATHCDINIVQSPFASRYDYGMFISEFPVPGYIRVEDMGVMEGTDIRTVADVVRDRRKAKRKQAKKSRRKARKK